MGKPEVEAKCVQADRSVLCVDAYSALSKGQDSIDANSTDAFLWLLESAAHFENLQETDNAIMVTVKAIDLAASMNLIERGYEVFRYARLMFEDGVLENDPSLENPMLKMTLFRTGKNLIAAARKASENSDVAEVQAELKASIL
ncbi:MAG: hypothetical protein ACFE7R_06940, partial [Candidatus Hodarchaeota archaeon]